MCPEVAVFIDTDALSLLKKPGKIVPEIGSVANRFGNRVTHLVNGYKGDDVLVYQRLVTGFALSLARALGEYGSVVFISGNMPFKTEIAPVLIVARLEEFAYAEATTIAVVLLAISITLLVVVNTLQQWLARNAQ